MTDKLIIFKKCFPRWILIIPFNLQTKQVILLISEMFDICVKNISS